MSKRKPIHKKEQEENYYMTEKNLKICLDNQDRYFTPELNDVLELHFYGFAKIENLEPFQNINTLYLQNNVLTQIENLSHLTKLVTLNLSNNRITHIGGLEKLTQLSLLDLSHNKIREVQGLRDAKKLTLLNLANNQLEVPKSVAQLEANESLTCLHLSNNPLINDLELLENLAKIPSLLTLYMKETKFSRGIKNYRKETIFNLKKITYLDDRPVAESQRMLVNAWKEGGIVRENEVRKEIQISKEEKNHKIYSQIRERSLKFEKLRDQLFQRLAIAEIKQLEELQKQFKEQKEKQKTEEDVLKIKLLSKKIEELEIYLKLFREDVDGMAVGQIPEVPTNLCERHEPEAIYIYGVSDEQIPKIKEKYYPEEERPLIAKPFKKDEELRWVNRYDQILEEMLEEHKENPELLLVNFNLKVHEVDTQSWRKARRFKLEELEKRMLKGEKQNEMNELD